MQKMWIKAVSGIQFSNMTRCILFLSKQEMIVAEKTHAPSRNTWDACIGAHWIQLLVGNNGIFFAVGFIKGLIYNNIGYVITAEELVF